MGSSRGHGAGILALAVVLCASSAQALSEMGRMGKQLPPAEIEMGRARQVHEADQAFRRRHLLQTSTTYPSNAAPSGTVTAGGLYVYTPINSTALDADDFSQFLYDTYNNKTAAGVYLTPGDYRVVSAQADYKVWLIYFGCTNNPKRAKLFQLSLTGSTLYTGNRNRALLGLDTCSNIAVQGGNVTYAADQLPFTQGTITNISDSNWTMSVDPGYPGSELIEDGRGRLCVLYDPVTGGLIQNGSDFYGGPFTSLGGRLFTLQTGFYFPTVAVGQRVVCRGDTDAQHVIFCNNCVNFRMTGTNIYSSNIFAVFEAQSRNSTYDGLSVVPDPRGVNGITPLFASNADGIHSTLPYSGPSIINCKFDHTGDDAIAVHGNYYAVAKVNSNTTTKSLIIASWNCNDPSCLGIFVGDTLLLYSPTFKSLGGAAIKTIVTTSNPQTISGASTNAPSFSYDSAYYFQLTFSAFPTAWSGGGPDGFVTVPSHNGQNTIINNNTLGNNRARGIYYKGSNGQVTNNRILQPLAVGLLLAPDLTFLEADFNTNVVIRGNYINITTLGLYVASINATLQAVVYQNHNNITITNNTIESSVKPVIIGSATKVTMQNNTIKNGGCYPYFNGDIFYNQQTTPNALVYVTYTTSSTFKSNVFTSTRPECRVYGNYTSPYQRGPGISGTTFG